MRLSDVQLAAFDMDGTLLNPESQFSDATREACELLQKQGCKLLLATGRTYLSAHMPVNSFPFDGYVCSNGAAIIDRTGVLVKKTPLAFSTISAIVDLLQQQKAYFELHDTESHRWILLEERDSMEQMLDADTADAHELQVRRTIFYKLSNFIAKQDLLELIEAEKSVVVKVFIWHNDPKQMKQITQLLQTWMDVIDITSSGDNNVEVIPKGVSKWSGLQYFLQKWNIDPNRVAAFGDADNDREILSNVGYSVAMGNASEEIKAITRFVTKSNAEDGVADFIRNHLLQHP